MKTIIFNLSVIFISLSFIAGIKAQDDTTGMNEASTTIKINIDDLTIPKEIRAGESFDFSIKIQNISKFSEWTSNYLTFDNEPGFTVAKSGVWKTALNPGESDKFSFKVTAPDTKGTGTLKLTVYNYGKKKFSITRQIDVTGSE